MSIPIRRKQSLVSRDSMSITIRHDWLSINRFWVSWSPGEEISSDLDVIVCEFTELIVVHTEEFGFLRGAKMETWDEIDEEGEESGDDKGVGDDGDDVRELDVHLFPVLVEEAACYDAGVDTVETDDVVGAEEGVEE